MQHKIAAYLEDIRLAADDAMQFAEGVDEREYLANDLVRSAVERQLTIAGEALSQLAKHAPEVAEQIPEWRQIISFRNILIHGYRVLDHALIYRIIRNKLPTLRVAVAKLIHDIENS